MAEQPWTSGVTVSTHQGRYRLVWIPEPPTAAAHYETTQGGMAPEDVTLLLTTDESRELTRAGLKPPRTRGRRGTRWHRSLVRRVLDAA